MKSRKEKGKKSKASQPPAPRGSCFLTRDTFPRKFCLHLAGWNWVMRPTLAIKPGSTERVSVLPGAVSPQTKLEFCWVKGKNGYWKALPASAIFLVSGGHFEDGGSELGLESEMCYKCSTC